MSASCRLRMHCAWPGAVRAPTVPARWPICGVSIVAKAHHGTNGPRTKPPTQGAVRKLGEMACNRREEHVE